MLKQPLSDSILGKKPEAYKNINASSVQIIQGEKDQQRIINILIQKNILLANKCDGK